MHNLEHGYTLVWFSSDLPEDQREQLREVAQLSSEGVSLPAIARLLDLEDENRMLRDRVVALESALRAERENRPGVRVFAAGSAGVVPMPTGRRIRRSTELVLWSPRSGA